MKYADRWQQQEPLTPNKKQRLQDSLNLLTHRHEIKHDPKGAARSLSPYLYRNWFGVMNPNFKEQTFEVKLVEAKVDESKLELERRQRDIDQKISIINSYPEGKRRLEIKRLNMSILNGEEYFLPG